MKSSAGIKKQHLYITKLFKGGTAALANKFFVKKKS